jgi:hypothetical protein
MRGRKELAMCVIDPNTPRYQLPFEELPRGIVRFPARVIEGCELLQTKVGVRFTEDYLRESLEMHTLVYYYQDYYVAYRSVPGGIEVFGVGYDEVEPYRNARDGDVKVVRPW